jgi:ABC-type uncharacterized transport system permease subunit
LKARNRLSGEVIYQIQSFGGAILLALLVGFFLLRLEGFSPGEVLTAANSSTFATPFRFANTISRMLTLVLVSLAAAIPFKTGIWNIGGDGQLAIGGFFTAIAGIYLVGLPPVIHITLSILAGMIGGGLWASIPAFLRLKFNANEIVTTIMMNYLAALVTGYLVNYPFRAPGAANAETLNVAGSAYLAQLVPLSNLSSGLYIVIAVFLLICFIDWKTIWGYEWRILGANDEFARYGGVRDVRMRMLSMIIGGALAGLAGSILVLGSYHKFMLNLGGGIGFTGVLIAIIGANSPVLILILSSLFAILSNGTIGLEAKLGVATEFSGILQGLIIILVITRNNIAQGVGRLFRKRKDVNSG